MFFVISKLFGFLAMPITIIVVCFVFSWFFRNHKSGKLSFIIGLSALLFFTNPMICKIVLEFWEIPPIAYTELDEVYDYGIVLTGMLTLDGLPDDRIHFNQSSDRIHHAIELYRKGIIKKILITGGSSSIVNDEKREAPLLAMFANTYGVNASDIIIEPNARNTYENAKYSLKTINYQNANPKPKLLIITSAFHMRRTSACFFKQNAEFVPFTTGYQSKPMVVTPETIIIPSIEAFKWWHVIQKEVFGLIAYKLVGYI